VAQGNRFFTAVSALISLTALSACAMVGPDFVQPGAELPAGWSEDGRQGMQTSPIEQPQWWKLFNDPVLNQLVETAWIQNNSLEIAGLRVLEARAQLGIAEGNIYPQTQVAAGSAIYSSPAKNAGGGPNGWTNSIGLSASWEMDFWGRFRRSIEATDAAFFASVAARDQALILLTAQVVDTYFLLRSNEELLGIAKQNMKIQQRSYEIATTLFRNGHDSELDMQQAKTLLLSTKATIPGYEVAIKRARNALSTLLGKAPGTDSMVLSGNKVIPALPEQVNVSIPAELLRSRPDVRQAELAARAQNARVGVATADLYPSFSLSGTVGLVAAGTGNAAFSNLFGKDALTYSAGPSFVWPFLNYGRIRNSIRVQDARLQQALIQYRETVIQAAREVEDAMTGFNGARVQSEIMAETVISAKRSNQLSMFRYKEGFSDYQRVLDSQQALFSQQQNMLNSRTAAARSLVSLYKALGSGWENRPQQLISEHSRSTMSERTDWGELLDSTPEQVHDAEPMPVRNQDP
jgi:NodT family efflux transporter outer membrane factor (OMF) lipoprotein